MEVRPGKEERGRKECEERLGDREQGPNLLGCWRKDRELGRSDQDGGERDGRSLLCDERRREKEKEREEPMKLVRRKLNRRNVYPGRGR